MIDTIFEMIMRVARSRPGKDLVSNIHNVLLEIDAKVTKAIEDLRAQERREQKDENKEGNP